MKTLRILLLFFFVSIACQAQVNILSDMQGLSDEGNYIFEVEGYTIIIEKNKIALDDKGIKKIKKKYDLKDVVREYRDTTFKWTNYVIESTSYDKSVPEVINYQLCYLFPETDDVTTAVFFESLNRRNEDIEHAFINAFFSREVLKYASDEWGADKINFAGRNISLGDVCSWVSPFNVHCPSFGQISWSVFREREDAEINNDAHLLINKKSGMYKMQAEEDVDIIFEGIPTKAKRVIYKMNRSKVLLGGRNLLAVYYVVQKVRGRYLSSVLSHYIEDKSNYRLSPLLEEVMSLDTNSDNK